jgi:iron complex transport system ATP-binding protein
VRRFTIITGPRDSGKTRCASAFVEKLRAGGTTVGGVIAEAQVHEGRKVGYTFRDVMSDERMPYAIRRAGAVPGSGLGYRFLARGLAFGRAAISRSIHAGVAFLIVDELGPLEMSGGGLWEAVQEAVAHFPGTIIVTTRPSLVEMLCTKLDMSDDDVSVVPAAGDPDGLC